MFNQFRSRYPTGSLISDLLTIYEGRYLVRSVIQVEGTILATGMAAEDTLEEAEDRSRMRALAVLGITQQAPAAPIREMPEQRFPPSQPAPAFSTLHLGQGRTRPTPPSPAVGSSGTFSEQMPSTPQAPSSQASVEESSSTSDDWLSSPESREDTWKPDTSFTRQPSEAPPDFSQTSPAGEFATQIEFESPYEPSRSSMERENGGSAPTATDTSDPSSESAQTGPVDFSDVIAQTTVEIKRLRWTTEQGRTHLEKYYGKRSRSLLNEEELLDFLNYLKVQPTP